MSNTLKLLAVEAAAASADSARPHQGFCTTAAATAGLSRAVAIPPAEAVDPAVAVPLGASARGKTTGEENTRDRAWQAFHCTCGQV